MTNHAAFARTVHTRFLFRLLLLERKKFNLRRRRRLNGRWAEPDNISWARW
jgi:hypothetical protein